MLRRLRPPPDELLASALAADAAWAEARGLGGIVFDLDNTLCAFGAQELPAQIVRHLLALQESGLHVAIVSNHGGEGRDGIRDALPGTIVGWRSGKPRTAGIQRVLGELGLAAGDTALVGDRIVTDGWAGWVAGMYTAMVPPVIGVGVDEGLRLKGKRLIERVWIEGATRLPGGRRGGR